MPARRPLVLAYHGLADVPRQLDPAGMMVPPDKFRRHVEILRGRGYRFVRQAEFAERLRAGEPLAGICSLTFDDAPEDNFTTLPGLLEELDLEATVFACTALLGEPYPFDAPEAAVRTVRRDELVELARNPRVEIGSHTRRHESLADAGEDEAHAELAASRAELEALIGAPVRSFAYPDCDYSPACPAAAARAGYTSAVTCGGRGGLLPFELARESPAPADGRLAFELKARGQFHRVRSAPLVGIARRLARPLRYGRLRRSR